MKLDLDSIIATIPCPHCGKQLQKDVGGMKREKHITCDTCGEIGLDTDKLREIEDLVNKELTNQLANFSATFTLKL